VIYSILVGKDLLLSMVVVSRDTQKVHKQGEAVHTFVGSL